jgi:starch synthase
MNKMPSINVLYLASEADPLVKVGGLGDVAGSLPPALRQLTREKAGGITIDVRVALPFHAAIRKKVYDPELLCEFNLDAREGPLKTQVYTIEENNVPTYLIAGEPIGEDAPVYDPDAALDGHKYIFFSMAALEMVKLLDWKPDILHANDWHTALSVYALDTKSTRDPFYRDIRSVLTIHNLPFMGAGSADAFERFGLTASNHPLMPWWAIKFPLPLGLQAADRIVAVSPTYASEILTPEYGCGLENFLESRRDSISGILNGIDQESWDPATDANIPMNFNISSLTRRKLNKAALIDEFSLDSDPKKSLLILISRMDQQKGVDLAIGGLNQAMNDDWQAILLGTGDAKLEEACRQLEKRYPERVRAAIRFDTNLSRRMYAGGDILLMPSRYEPCGLAQMMAMRYGCVPLARATGGLQDTIIDSEENRTGFLFQSATSTALAEALHRALEIFPDQERWTAIQRRGMSQDFSWENSAIQYAKLYRGLLQEQPG